MNNRPLAVLLCLAFTLALRPAPAAAARAELPPRGVVRSLTGAQPGEPVALALEFVRGRAAELGLTARDLDDLRATSYRSQRSGLTHVYLRQRRGGIEVFGGDIAVHVGDDGRIWKVSSSFAAELGASIATAGAVLDATAAVERAVRHLELELDPALTVTEDLGGAERAVVFAPSGVSLEPIPARLMYFESAPGEVRLGWNVRIYPTDAQDYWNLLLDAETGAVLVQNNWVDRESYRTYEMPLPSPGHTAPLPPADTRTLAVDPAEPTASPYGWHSTTTTPGEFLATRGNNVDAYEDQDNSNAPTGGDAARAVSDASLVFDFPIDLDIDPATYVDAAVTSLFYTSNMLHDILHRYGFDEASGNFQVNNYGLGGTGGDDVQAEAQDGGGRNNANFFTPVDGQRPRMQMYLWDPPGATVFTVNSPASIAGEYFAVPTAFSVPTPPAPGLNAEIVLVQDEGLFPTYGCARLLNDAEIAGNIALADVRGCPADGKASRAEIAGAIALIVMGDTPGLPPVTLPGQPEALIPTVMIGFDDAQLILAQLGTPGVNATLENPLGATTADLDGDLDNELIAHEYGHGVSNRLVGGPDNVDCLSGSEQPGEGWSDLLALMLTARPGDAGGDSRGAITYSTGDVTTGSGIRGVPYSTDLTISPRTYGDIGGLQVPHETGSVWTSAGWEIFWAMVDRYGFDPDLIAGDAGNNRAIQLIIDGMKLTTCDPGFVDARDGVLMADQVLYGGANQCLLWEAFAKRGLGEGALQGTNDVADETESFAVPASCLCPAAVEQGNVLRAWRGPPDPLDVQLDFDGATGSTWRAFRDGDKASLRVTPLLPDVTAKSFVDPGAVAAATGSPLFYRIAEVDCAGDAGP